MTDFHGYNTPKRGAVNWDGPLNENFRQIDADMEVRDVESNLSAYSPTDGAKFFSTDTGAIYLADGSNWNKILLGTATIDESITPTWTGEHTFDSGLTLGSGDTIDTFGGGSDTVTIRDAANGQDLIVANEGGAVDIPNGNLTVGDADTPFVFSAHTDTATYSGLSKDTNTIYDGGRRETDVNDNVIDVPTDTFIASHRGFVDVGGTFDRIARMQFKTGDTSNAVGGGSVSGKITFELNDSSGVDTDIMSLLGDDQSVTIHNGTFIHDRQSISTNTTTDGSGYYSVDSSGGTVTVTLATADAVDGKEINIKRNGANNVTVDTGGAETIDDATTYTIAADNDSITVIYNSSTTDWEVF